MTSPLHMAEIDWNEDGLPLSRHYGDVYFSNEGGLDEARHVFLAGNHLAQRLANAEVFTVGETGFGSGLNFLALWELWEKTAPSHARLCFFSAEKHPLCAEDMARIHALFPQISQYGKQLCAQLPLPVPGYHRLYFAGGRIQLTLMYGDALDMLREQDAMADAWFLDGFAPRLNPDLWSAELARELSRLSANGATVATFSTSTSTQQALGEAGCVLQKQSGFGRKKHMLTGHFPASAASRPIAPSQATIVGGGLAGASVAHALAQRGCTVQVHEQQSVVASGASGNPSAIFYPGVTIGWQPLSQLYFMGFSHTLMLLRQLAEQQAIAHDLCGMLLFPKPHEDPLRQAKVLATMQPHSSIFYGVDAAQASEHAGIALKQSGLFFPASGWVNLKDFTAALLANPHIEVITSHAITAMQFDCVAPTVLCNGWHAQQLYAPLQGAMHPVAGQVSGLPAAQATDGLRCVLSYGGYITPPIGSVHHVGATYDKRCDARYDAEADVQNIAKLSQFLQVGMPISATKEGWFAVRSVTRNRLPLVGKLQDGLYASLAHASRGLLSCGLAGEYVASQLYGDPLPLPRSIACLLRPDRFVA